ncbi:MAG: chorismate mutase [Bacteroidota bacterium]|nr:chorismate mutase [Bacteroidota bacterium]
MELIPFQNWDEKLKNNKNLFIAGPCSAENRNQLVETALEISQNQKVKIFRAGVWKPRTTPNSFEGVGEKALDWLKEVKQKTDLLTCVEIATPKHLEICLKNKGAVDVFWIGARTVANPFALQALADALKGVDVPVMVKNPVIPDLKLWIGAIERLYKNGINKIAAIHRGFYPFEETRYRNIPKWELIVNLKMQLPQLQIIGDPSHIAGKTELIEEVSALFMSMNVDGLMIETHNNPNKALSDAKQQVTPAQLNQLLEKLNFEKISTSSFNTEIKQLRIGIDSIDFQILDMLSQRFDIVEKIGAYKYNNNISVLQLDRWRKIIKSRLKVAKELNLELNFTKKIMQLVHKESIEIQSKICKNL